jgi:hypothetical protein
MRCDSVRCIVYRSNEPSVRVALEPVIGYIWFRDTKSSGLQGGVVCSFAFPNNNTNLQFKTGILFNQSLDTKKRPSFAKIPVQVRYPFVFNRIQLCLDWGIAFNTKLPYSYNGLSTPITAAGGGDVLFTINKRAYCIGGIGFDMIPLLFILGNSKYKSTDSNHDNVSDSTKDHTNTKFPSFSVQAGFGFKF